MAHEIKPIVVSGVPWHGGISYLELRARLADVVVLLSGMDSYKVSHVETAQAEVDKALDEALEEIYYNSVIPSRRVCQNTLMVSEITKYSEPPYEDKQLKKSLASLPKLRHNKTYIPAHKRLR